MKKLIRVLAAFALVLGCLGWMGQQQALALNLSDFAVQSSPVLAAESQSNFSAGTPAGEKTDINNASIRAFTKYRGFYPTLASKIVQNAPYENVEDVMNIPELSESQKKRLQANLDNFEAGEIRERYVGGNDRFNPGVNW
jgi:photosystem II PsbU protein